MTFTPVFAPDAHSQWRALEIEFQEAVLDKLDRLCQSPPDVSEHISDIVIEQGAARHFLFFHFLSEPFRRFVTLVGIGYCTRPRIS